MSAVKNLTRLAKKPRFKPVLAKLNIESIIRSSNSSFHTTACSNPPETSLPNSNTTTSPTGTCIIPNKLYLSDLEKAKDPNFLKINNITAIISLYPQSLPQHIISSLSDYLHINIKDNCSVKISNYFQSCIRFIDNNETVLIHCQAGISRSPTIVMAYLIEKMGLGWKEAYKFVQDRRSVAGPNFSFFSQLHEYETKVRAKISDNKVKIGEKIKNSEKFEKLEIYKNFVKFKDKK